MEIAVGSIAAVSCLSFKVRLRERLLSGLEEGAWQT